MPRAEPRSSTSSLKVFTKGSTFDVVRQRINYDSFLPHECSWRPPQKLSKRGEGHLWCAGVAEKADVTRAETNSNASTRGRIQFSEEVFGEVSPDPLKGPPTL